MERFTRKYWVLSPNVKDGSDEAKWKESISTLKRAFIGYDASHRFGQLFKNDIQLGDVILIAQGQNSSKKFFLCGIVDSEANYEYVEDTPDTAQNRKLKFTISKERLDELDLDFNDSTWGESKQPATLYHLKPIENEADKIIVEKLASELQNQIIYQLMDNIKLSVERQNQLKALWEKFKSETKAEDKDFNTKEIENLLAQWKQYKEKITNDTLSLDAYTNTLGNVSATMPGGYLCNFLERTTRTVLGSSKPGTAFNFEVKLNNDSATYYILKQNKQNASRTEAESHFNDNIKGLLKSIVFETDPLAKIKLVEEANYSAKQILMKMAVLDNLSDFLYIYSTQWLEELYNDFIDGDAEGIFTKNHQVCLVAKKLLEVNEQDKGELILLSRFLWRYVNAKTIADADNPNVIMYGPPGTGKTYSVVNSLDFVSQGDSSRYELLQFHPSFTYEDFIEGIKPKGVSKDGNIRFELVNGAFKNFCIKAKNNPGKAFYFVVDEINRANLSSVFGETLSLLEKDYRHDGKSNKNLIKTQYSALIEDLIREDDKYKSLAYIIDNGEVKFGVPANVFFIGMMNDVDKSIDSLDLALRRRFKWIRKDCDYEVVEEETRFKRKEDFSNIGHYIKACEKLNNYIANDLGLGKSYEFGHSFFMKMSDIAKRKEITQHNLEVLFNLYLRPTLKEYLRAVFAESELDNKLIEALNKFKETLK